jgi:hypothetical protein
MDDLTAKASPLNPEKQCFVIMPFSSIPGICTERQWTFIFETLIRPSVENAGLGYRCRRSNPTMGNIIKNIINDLSDSDAVIADLTGQNANVFYELGVRHALRGRSILLAQDKKYIPSDLFNYAYYIYNSHSERSKKDFQEKIASLLKQLDEIPDRTDNPVEDYLNLTPEKEVLYLFLQANSDIQRIAMKEEIKKCTKTLNQIRRGQIPIQGGDTGYFDHFLRIIEANTTREHVKVFVQATPLEVGHSRGLRSFERFGLQELYQRLNRAVREHKLSIEYIFLLLSSKSLNESAVQYFLQRYKSFSREIRLVFEDITTLKSEDIEDTLALLTDHRIAFTHRRGYDGNIDNPVKWTSNSDYERFVEKYDRIKVDSKEYFLPNEP